MWHAIIIVYVYGRPGCVSFVKEWIDARQISEELKDELDELYGGTV